MNSSSSILAYIQNLLGEDFNISLFLSIVRKSLIWIIVFVFIAVLIVFLYLRYTLPEYRTSSTLMYKTEKTAQILGVSKLLADEPDEVSREIQLIKSSYFVERVVSKLPVEVSYFKEGRTKFVSTELYNASPFIVEIKQIKNPNIVGLDIYLEFLNDKSFILKYNIDDNRYREILSFGKFFETADFEIRVNLSSGTLPKLSEHVGQSYFFRINDLSKYAKEIASKIQVVPLNPNTKTMQIVFQDRNKIKVRDITNVLADEFIKYDVERKIESTTQILDFLKYQIDTFGRDLALLQDTLTDYRLRNHYISPSQEINILSDRLYNLDQKKADILFELKVIDWFYHYIENLKDLNMVSSSLLGGELGSVPAYLNKIKELENKRDDLLLDVSPEHPKILMLNEQIVKTKNELINDLENITKRYNYRMESIDDQYNESLSQLFSLPEKEAAFSRIQREYNIKEKFYLNLIDKQANYNIAKAGIVSDYLILSKASVPEEAVGLEESYLWIMAIAGAFGLGVLLIAVRYLLHNTILSVETIRKRTKASVLGVVPTVFTDLPSSSIVVTENPKSMISESFRSIRANLQFLSNEPGPKTIAITSTVSGEGKTFIAVNLGAILSVLDKKVIILDVDMRRPRLSKIFQVENVVGMSTILIGKDKYEDCIFRTELKNLHFITSGPIPPNPAELLLSDRLKQLVEKLKTEYDFVIFDTPPLGLVTDGFELIKGVNYPIYVFRADYSSKTFITNLDKLIDENKVNNLSVILNDVGRGVSGYSYGYGGYGYKYGYGYGYGYSYNYGHSGYYTDSAVAKKPFWKRLIGKS